MEKTDLIQSLTISTAIVSCTFLASSCNVLWFGKFLGFYELFFFIPGGGGIFPLGTQNIH